MTDPRLIEATESSSARRETWIEERVQRYADSLCKSYWHDEGHASHSACASCGSKFMRKSAIADHRRMLTNFARNAERYASEVLAEVSA